MTVIDRSKIIDTIKSITIDLDSYPDDFLEIYQFIKNSINQDIAKIQFLEIDLIAVEDIYSDYQELGHHNIVLQKKEREVINIFIVGNFQQDSKITWEMSEVLADFFVDFLIIPILNNINYEEFHKNSDYILNNIKHSIVVYEAKRSIS